MPRVVVIDDEESMRELTKGVLSNGGFDVVTAKSAADFLEKVENGSIKPGEIDLVLTDVMMPGMTGLELCRRMREDPILSQLKVALITVVEYSKLSVSENIRKLGILDYIQKPYMNQDLIERVKRMCSSV